MGNELTTDRLVLRPWRIEDAPAALDIYGDPEIARWLSPALGDVPDLASMQLVLEQWITEDARTAPPAGRWAIESRADGRLLGGAVLLPLPPGGEDLEFGWQLLRQEWGNGYATEAGRAVARWAFSHHQEEIFAVVRVTNSRAAAVARRIGMEWVGETDKYYGLHLHVFRLRYADLLAISGLDQGIERGQGVRADHVDPAPPGQR
jgi:RimJ/RimL family protein N-acetyltransferase